LHTAKNDLIVAAEDGDSQPEQASRHPVPTLLRRSFDISTIAARNSRREGITFPNWP